MAVSCALLRVPAAARLVLGRRCFVSAAEAPVRLAPRRRIAPCWGPSACCEQPPVGWVASSTASGSRGFASSAPGESDPYKVLGVPRTATADEIKAAYRKHALKWHPDRHPESERKVAEKNFSAAASAYETLSDPAKKRQYDSGGSPFSSGGSPGGPPHGGFQGFGGFPAGGAHSQESAERLFREVFGAHGMNDIFAQILGAQKAQGTLQVGQEVAVLKENAAVVRACRDAGIDSTNDVKRRQCLGKTGRIVKVDPKDQTLKVSVSGVGDVWFGARAVRSIRRGGSPADFGTDPFAAFGAMGAGIGPGTVTMRQEVVVKPDGSRVMRVTRTSRGPDGRTREEVYETPMQ